MNPDLKENEIPKSVLQAFLESKITLAEMKNVNKVEQHQVDNDKFRINVWTSQLINSELIPSNKIAHSYYVTYESMDDGIIDKTIVNDEI